jgi:hypothetical protein
LKGKKLAMGGKNVGVIVGGLFLAAMFYLSSSGLVTVVRAVIGLNLIQ